jgi:hypothetical protein
MTQILVNGPQSDATAITVTTQSSSSRAADPTIPDLT